MERTDAKEPKKSENWPNLIRNRDELDDALVEGEMSGIDPRSITDISNSIISKLKDG